MYWFDVKISLLFVMFLGVALNSSGQQFMPLEYIDRSADSRIYSIYQDRIGYIWVGTNDGVYKYNGYQFKHFTKKDGLSDNEILRVKEDLSNRIWLMTYNGRPTVIKNDTILTAKNTTYLKSIHPKSFAYDLLCTNDTVVYVTKKSAYFIDYDSVYKKVKIDDFNIERSGFIESDIYKRNPFLFINTAIFNIRNYSLQQLSKDYLNERRNQKVIVVNKIMVNCVGATILLYDIVEGEYEKKLLPADTKCIDYCFNKADNSIYILTNTCIYKYALDTKVISRILEFDIPSPNAIMVDKHNNIWISTALNGMYFSKYSSIKIFNAANVPMTTSEVTCLKYYNGKVFAGYINSEFFSWLNDDDFSFLRANSDANLDKVYSFEELDGKLLAISGFAVFDALKPNKRVEHSSYSLKSLSKVNDYVYVALSQFVSKIPSNQLAAFLNYNEHNIISRYISDNIVYFGRVNTMLSVNDDSLYLGTRTGMKLLVNDHIKTITESSRANILNEEVTKIIKTKNNIVFSTNGEGVGVLSKGTCYAINTQSGLPSNQCKSVFSEDDSTLWVATDLGLCKVRYRIRNNKIQSQTKTFSLANKLPSSYINDVLLINDTIWLATKKGLGYFFEDEMFSQIRPDSVIIENVFVNSKKVYIDKEKNLTHSQNNISIEFVSLSYGLRDDIEYMYQLNGVDIGWNYTKTNRIEYPTLSPGKYVFTVKAISKASRSESTPTILKFEVYPPFWKTMWFIFIVIGTTLFLSVFLIGLRIRKLKRKHLVDRRALELQKENAEFKSKLSVLEQNALSLQMNPHFIFNSINAIKGLYTNHEFDKAEEYISKFALLMRKMLENNTRATVTLQEEINILETYMELSMLRQGEKFTYKINIKEGLSASSICLPPMLLQPLVENSLVHGIASLSTSGHVEISFTTNGDMLICTIIDNGIGIQKSKEYNKYKLHKSRGIEITAKRIRLLSDDSDFMITDVYDSKGKVTGAKVVIHLRLADANNNYYDKKYNS